jgi:hypothetical protein
LEGAMNYKHNKNSDKTLQRRNRANFICKRNIV